MRDAWLIILVFPSLAWSATNYELLDKDVSEKFGTKQLAPVDTRRSTGTSGGSSGGGTVTSTINLSSTTIYLETAGDLFRSTNPTVNGTYYTNYKSTFNISYAYAYQSLTSTYSTCSSTYSVAVSTGGTNGGRIQWTTIDSSSWTMTYAQVFSTDTHRPSYHPRVLPGEQLFMFQHSDPSQCGGNIPGGNWGVALWGWFEP